MDKLLDYNEIVKVFSTGSFRTVLNYKYSSMQLHIGVVTVAILWGLSNDTLLVSLKSSFRL